MSPKKPSRQGEDIVTLADLAPRQNVTGGSQRRVFGADPVGPSVSRSHKPGTQKDLAARPASAVRGGRSERKK